MSFLGTRNAVAIGVSQHLTLGGPDLLSKLSPSLILQFAGAQTMDPRITFTRSTTATFTDSNGLLQTAAINAPRFDYDPVTLAPRGLLIEEQRTNLVLYSEMFADAAWAKTRASITANVTVAPDGTTTADKLVEDTTALNTHLIVSSSPTLASGTVYTCTVFAKSAERTNFAIQIGTGSEAFGALVPYAMFNLDTVTTSNVLHATATITAVGNGWYRCTLVTVAATVNAATSVRLKLANASGAEVYTGNGYSGIYIWGAQLEAGAFPTSYIPTVASQVTRAPDVAVMTGTNFSSWYNQTAGTIYAEVVYNGQLVGSAAETNAIIIDDGTASNRFTIRTVRDLSAPQADVTVFSDAASQMDSAGFVPVIVDTQYKRALAYALNNAIPCVNGVLDGATDTSFAVPVGANRLALPTTLCALYIRKIAYYPRRLSNAALQGITS